MADLIVDNTIKHHEWEPNSRKIRDLWDKSPIDQKPRSLTVKLPDGSNVRYWTKSQNDDEPHTLGGKRYRDYLNITPTLPKPPPDLVEQAFKRLPNVLRNEHILWRDSPHRIEINAASLAMSLVRAKFEAAAAEHAIHKAISDRWLDYRWVLANPQNQMGPKIDDVPNVKEFGTRAEEPREGGIRSNWRHVTHYFDPRLPLGYGIRERLGPGKGVPYDLFLVSITRDQLEKWGKEVAGETAQGELIGESQAGSTEPSRTEDTTLPADPYAELREYARKELKGKARAVIEAICTAEVELPLGELAVKDGVDWDDPNKGFESLQSRLNPKLKKRGWKLSRQNNAAHLVPIPANTRSATRQKPTKK